MRRTWKAGWKAGWKSGVNAGTLFALVALISVAGCNRGDDDTDMSADDMAAGGEERFTATLTGDAERPPVTTDATGTAEFTFTSAGSITYTVSATNLSGLPSGAHIHGPASADSSAGVLVPLEPLATVMSGVLASGTITADQVREISFDSLKTLIRDGMTYVNVHTPAHPNGEIRGQLRRQ